MTPDVPAGMNTAPVTMTIHDDQETPESPVHLIEPGKVFVTPDETLKS